MTSKTSGKPTLRRASAGKQGSRAVRRLRGGRPGKRAWTVAWALLAVVALGGLYLLYTSSAGGGDSTHRYVSTA